jgi:hypothetical protein
MRMLQNTKHHCHPRLVSGQYITVIDRPQVNSCSVASSSTEGKAIRTYVKNTLSRSRAKDVAYIQNRFMFKPDPEPVSTVHSPTFGFYKRAWSEVRCAHNRALYTKLLARDQQGFYAFLSHPLFQSVVSGFINARSLDGKVDRHSIQTYVDVIVSNKLYSERPLLMQT